MYGGSTRESSRENILLNWVGNGVDAKPISSPCGTDPDNEPLPSKTQPLPRSAATEQGATSPG